jgi:hypothetical protein
MKGISKQCQKQMLHKLSMYSIPNTYQILLTSCLSHWLKFAQQINQSKLITITPKDIWITEKIFSQIKKTQAQKMITKNIPLS